MKPRSSRIPAHLSRLMAAILLFSLLLNPQTMNIVHAGRSDLSGPAGSGRFGAGVFVLPNGNFVVTDPKFSPGGLVNIGAVYLYNGETREQISRLIGSANGDMVGSGGIKILKDGNFVVVSPRWNNGAITMAGAVTWCSALAGCTGVVSADNSLVGSHVDDYVGSTYTLDTTAFTDSPGIDALPGGAYLVRSALWDARKGAVTYCAGGIPGGGCLGVVSAGNSLVGSTPDDYIGMSVTQLPAGGYIVHSTRWTNGAMRSAGAVTPCPPSGCVGPVSTSNSLYGNAASDQIGIFVTPLTGGGFTVGSYNWGNAYGGLGAVTFCASVVDPNCVGQTISAANSLIGKPTVTNTMIGSSGVEALPDGSYLVKSPSWMTDAKVRTGALTHCTVIGGTSSCTGQNVTPANSLTGDSDQDSIGSAVVLLENGAFLATSAQWHNWTGAVTYCASPAMCMGQQVSAANSLVGSKSGPSWRESTGGDMIGTGGSKALSGGGYLVISPYWDLDGNPADIGAVTFCPAAGCTGMVSPANSLTGTSASDNIGMGSALQLPGGAIIIGSPYWDNGTAADAGAVTFCATPAECQNQTVGLSNSLVSDQAKTQSGYFTYTALANGAYLVSTPNWANGAAANAGALTWCPPGGCKNMIISASNSLVGSHAGDYAGYLYEDVGDNLYVAASDGWQNGDLPAAGAVTLCAHNTGCVGPVTAANSVLGSVPGEYIASWDYTSAFNTYKYDLIHHRLLVGLPLENKVVFFTLQQAPEATTSAASAITTSAATLNGSVNANGESTTVTFEYGLTTAYSASVTAAQGSLSGETAQAVSAAISGLEPNTTYHFRVVAANSAGTVYGNDLTFTTAAAAPSAETAAASGISAGGAVLNGLVNPNNSSTSVIFEYGLTTSYGSTVTAAQSPLSGVAILPVSAEINGLTPNTTYHFRVSASNSAGTVNGEDQTFSTIIVAPSAQTAAASGVTASGATLNGTVNPNNASATVTFEYGLTTAYGSTVTAAQSPVTGLTSVSVSAALNGLTPNTTYHYRVVGTNAGGASNGADRTFTTSAAAPSASSAAASAISAGGATLNGTVNANNASTTVTFEYGLTTAYGSAVTAAQSPLAGTTSTAVSAAISGLAPNTTYHFRVVAVNSAGTVNGLDQTFTTSVAAPTAQTSAASGITASGATLNGTVNGYNDSTTVTFEYGMTTAYGTSIAAAQSPLVGSTSAAVSVAVSGLAPNTTYHYRVVAVNSAGTTQGQDRTFTTSMAAPSASTSAASAVTAAGATLNGAVNAYNASTTVTFEYGTTTAYGTSIPAVQSPVSGAGDTPVSAVISGLEPNVTYHYRVVAENGAGSVVGLDQTFTTNTIEITISGSAGASGVVLSYTDGSVKTVSTSSGGAYSFRVPYRWTGTLTPAKPGYTFTPASLNFSSLTADKSGQNFQAVYTPPVIKPASEIKTKQFTASWSPCPGATTYYVDVSTDANFATFVPGYENRSAGGELSLAVTGLDPYTTYYYRVRAFDGENTSLSSSTRQATTLYFLAFPYMFNRTGF